MKIFIPKIKDELLLLEDWKVTIDHGTSINYNLWGMTKGHENDCKSSWNKTCGTHGPQETIAKIPAGSHLILDRIHAYTAKTQFDSFVNLRLVHCGEGLTMPRGKKSIKFHANFKDFNEARVDVVPASAAIKVNKDPGQGKPVSVTEVTRRIENSIECNFWIKGLIENSAVSAPARIMLRDYKYSQPAPTKRLKVRTHDWSVNFDIDNFDITQLTGGTTCRLIGVTSYGQGFDFEFFKIFRG